MRKHIQATYDFVKRVAANYSRDNGSLVAAAVSFYAFLSLIPLILLGASIGAFLLGSVEQAQSAVMRIVAQYYPVALRQDDGILISIIAQVVEGRAAATGISSVMLLVSGLTLMSALCRGINVAWGVKERRGFLRQKLADLFLLVSTAILLGLSLGITAFIELVRGLDIELFGLSIPDFPLIWRTLIYLVPLGITTAAFTLVYKVAPKVHVPTHVALLGGVFCGVMWELTKVAFGYYVAHVASVNSVYGSLGSVIILLIWINLSAVVTVLGAEVGSEWDRLERQTSKPAASK